MFFFFLLLAFAAYVLWAWIGWLQADEKFVDPRWRSWVTVIGFGAATTSVLIIVLLATHALLTGGFPYYHPVLMGGMTIGFLSALLGVLCALIGKGKLEIPTIVCSVLCLLILFVEAIAQ